MDSNEKFLSIEETLDSLIEELQNVKSASEQIQIVKETSDILKDSTEKMILKAKHLVEKTAELVNTIHEIKFIDRFNFIDSKFNGLKQEIDQSFKNVDKNQQEIKEMTNAGYKKLNLLIFIVIIFQIILTGLHLIKL